MENKSSLKIDGNETICAEESYPFSLMLINKCRIDSDQFGLMGFYNDKNLKTCAYLNLFIEWITALSKMYF